MKSLLIKITILSKYKLRTSQFVISVIAYNNTDH